MKETSAGGARAQEVGISITCEPHMPKSRDDCIVCVSACAEKTLETVGTEVGVKNTYSGSLW